MSGQPALASTEIRTSNFRARFASVIRARDSATSIGLRTRFRTAAALAAGSAVA
jgi:hypothetical protein